MLGGYEYRSRNFSIEGQEKKTTKLLVNVYCLYCLYKYSMLTKSIKYENKLCTPHINYVMRLYNSCIHWHTRVGRLIREIVIGVLTGYPFIHLEFFFTECFGL